MSSCCRLFFEPGNISASLLLKKNGSARSWARKSSAKKKKREREITCNTRTNFCRDAEHKQTAREKREACFSSEKEALHSGYFQTNYVLFFCVINPSESYIDSRTK